MTAPTERTEYGKRVAYIGDDDWSWVRRVAFLQNVTISAVVRGLIRLGRQNQDHLMEDVVGDSGPFNVNHHRWSDAQRAVILGGTTPFSEVRVPVTPERRERIDAVKARLTAEEADDLRSLQIDEVDSSPIEPGVKFGRAAFSEFRPSPKPTPRKRR